MDELVEGFGLGLVVGKSAEEAGAGGPDFLFVVHLGVIDDLLEFGERGKRRARGVEFEDAALMGEAGFVEFEFAVALLGGALFELFVGEVAVVARQDLEGGRRELYFYGGGEGGLVEEVFEGCVWVGELRDGFVVVGQLEDEATAFGVAANGGTTCLRGDASGRRLGEIGANFGVRFSFIEPLIENGAVFWRKTQENVVGAWC